MILVPRIPQAECASHSCGSDVLTGMLPDVRLIDFLARPDVREAPVRLLTRRVAVALADRFAPGLLRRDATFQLSNGLRMTASLSDTVGRDLFVHGTFEWATVRNWEDMLQAGDTAVDVGAHVGTFTLSAARRVGPTGRVVAFEPNAKTRELLERNVRQNGFDDRVTVMPYALLDRDDRLPLGTPTESNSGMSRLGHGDTFVTCRRLDDVLAELDVARVRAIKMDVEGFEAQVIAGGTRTFAERPSVSGPSAVERL